jgi:response regulator RpfG family c-di-GMP phosphodiesterase
MRHRTARGIRIEEALIEAGLSEKDLLTILAEMYRVQYISALKLSAAAIDKRTLALVPAQIAQQRQVVPVLLDRQRSILSVVTSDPDDIETMKELEIATQVRTIRALIARPAAVEAAVRKFYLGDDFAFALLRNDNYDVARALERDPLAALQARKGEPTLTERGMALPEGISKNASHPSEGFDQLDRMPGSGAAPSVPYSSPPAYIPGRPSHPAISGPDSPHSVRITPSYPTGPQAVPSYPALPSSGVRVQSPQSGAGYSAELPPPLEPVPMVSRAPTGSFRAEPVVSPRAHSSSGPPARSTQPSVEGRRVALTPPPPPPDPRDLDSSPLPLALSPAHARSEPPPLELMELPEDAHDARSPEELEELEELELEPLGDAAPATEPEAAKSRPSAEHPARAEAIGDPFQFALVLVSLLEGNRKDLRGHSLQTARLVRTVCDRFNVPAVRTRAAEVAALVHDLGKASSYHLTPYNVARFAGHHAAAQKLYTTPARVLESAGLAHAATSAVSHMYERYDGTGFPDGLKGNEIPLESRILAICDSYTDLTSNPRNSFRKVLSAQEACEALRELIGAVFDPKVIDRFSRAVLGDDIAQRIRGDRGTVLLVDPDVEETTVLELALLEKRYDVHVARAVDEALHFVESGGIDVVVSEMSLGAETGFELLTKIRGIQGGEAVPFVFLSGDTDGTKVAEALDGGASDYLFKPLATQVVVAKLRRLLEQAQSAKRVRGVSGSLEEMGIPDIVQILHQGRKTAALLLTSDGEQGTIFFKDGGIVDASWRGLRAEEAFYAIVGVVKGGFTIDPSVTPPEKVIKASPEMLLLEGMRRMDEANR